MGIYKKKVQSKFIKFRSIKIYRFFGDVSLTENSIKGYISPLDFKLILDNFCF
jgi:hypothetical protein